ncbi:hypothetical protein Vadar_023833 [Vaccinium darrowii]|uniref:Uncharacterized protein n=1 Tax=Vaccinium darrowii TaxID=229202 RepID=A0ACB7XKA4_9ERIC|nr:hypothetical protein Vadar_023833 [Vaccinium darrowii]
MFPNIGGAGNSGNNGKDVSPDTLAMPPPPPPPPTNYYSIQQVTAALRQNTQPPPPPVPQQNMNMPMLSFTSLLNDDHAAEIVEQGDQIDEIIKAHAEQLRRTLADKWQGHYRTLLCSAEERASKKLQEKEIELERTVLRNAELEQMVAHFSKEAQVWEEKVKRLEDMVGRLRAELLKRGGGGGAAEDSESSYVDPDRVEPVFLPCKRCGKRVATVMIWPCRHVCICKRCDGAAKACPVCGSVKTNSTEVVLP